MKPDPLPKHVLVYDAPDHLWGVARLRNPVVLMQLRAVTDDPECDHAEVILWPANLDALTTANKKARVLEALWGYLNSEDADEYQSYGPEQIDLTQALPRWLFLDDDLADFSAMLDTEKGVLWRIDESYTTLDAVMSWQMHPAMPPRLEFPASTREVAQVFRDWRRAEEELDHV